MNKEVVIVTYYWPPSGGVGVNRWLYFSKYLKDLGWNPIIVTPLNPKSGTHDDSLVNKIGEGIEVIKLPIWEPLSVFGNGKSALKNISRGALDAGESVSVFTRFAIWVRGNLFIPDGRRFWISPAYKFLFKLFKRKKIKFLITTGPPHSMHLVGMRLKKAIPSISWVADFRDPWSSWDIVNRMSTTQRAIELHKSMEKKVLKYADKILTVSPRLAKDFELLSDRKIDVIYNGFEPIALPDKVVPKKFTLSYFGLLNEFRNPHMLWKGLDELLNEYPLLREKFKLRISGAITKAILSEIRGFIHLSENLYYTDYISRDETIVEYNKSSLLLIILNHSPDGKWSLPYKLYESLSFGKPILMIGDEDSDGADIISKDTTNAIFDFEDKQGIKSWILRNFELFENEKSVRQQADYSRYSKVEIAKELSSILESLAVKYVQD